MLPKPLKRRKGVSFSMQQIMALLLIVIFAAIVLAFFLPTAESVGDSASCSNPAMKAIASQIRSATGQSVIC